MLDSNFPTKIDKSYCKKVAAIAIFHLTKSNSKNQTRSWDKVSSFPCRQFGLKSCHVLVMSGGHLATTHHLVTAGAGAVSGQWLFTLSTVLFCIVFQLLLFISALLFMSSTFTLNNEQTPTVLLSLWHTIFYPNICAIKIILLSIKCYCVVTSEYFVFAQICKSCWFWKIIRMVDSWQKTFKRKCNLR